MQGREDCPLYTDIPLVNNASAVSMHVYIVTPAKRVQ